MTTDSIVFWFSHLALYRARMISFWSDLITQFFIWSDLTTQSFFCSDLITQIFIWSDFIMQIFIWSDVIIQHFFLIRFYRQYSFLSIHQSHTIKSSSSFFSDFDLEILRRESYVFLRLRSWNSRKKTSSVNIILWWFRSWNSQQEIMSFDTTYS